MKIAVDVREACAAKRTGKGQWSRFFVTELLRRGIPVTLFTDTSVPEEWQRLPHVSVVLLRQKGLRWHWSVARLLRRGDCSMYFSPTSFIVPFLLSGKGFPVVPVVHDLIAFQSEPHDRKARLIERCTLGRTIRGASFVCTVSESTKRDLLQRFSSLSPDKVVPIFAGPVASDAIVSHPDGQTILSIGTLCPRKNQLRLIQAFAFLPPALRERSRLVLVGGRGWHDNDIVRLARETPGVEWKGYLAQQEWETLFARATIFAFPSLYEGFGMPILDAFYKGVPVLTSDRGSLREVAGGAACIVDPENVSSIAAGLTALLSSSVVRDSLRAKGKEQALQFSWSRSVDLFLEGLSTLPLRAPAHT